MPQSPLNSVTPTPAQTLGFVLTRIVVPVWVLTGAVFKLVEHTPKNLPTQIWQRGIDVGIDLHILLAALVAIEFVMVGLMLFVPKLARIAAITMLSIFVLVLLNEMRTDNFTSCGCLGKIPVKPWQMLTIDSLLLVGVIVFGRNVPRSLWSRMACPLGAIALPLAGIIGCALVILPERASQTRIVANGKSSGSPIGATQPDKPSDTGPQLPTTDPTIPDSPQQGPVPPTPAVINDPLKNPSPTPQPPSWYVQNIESWIGKPWREIDLFKLMPVWPKGLDDPKRYVVFYSRTCEHCEAMFMDDLIIPLDAPITAIEIPQDRNVLTDPAAWKMPNYKHVDLAALPVGITLWMITPPLALRLENGIVTCATESEHKVCLGIP